MRKTHRHAGGYRSLDCLILTILVGPSLGAKSQNLSAQRGNSFVWAVFDRAILRALRRTRGTERAARSTERAARSRAPCGPLWTRKALPTISQMRRRSSRSRMPKACVQTTSGTTSAARRLLSGRRQVPRAEGATGTGRRAPGGAFVIHGGPSTPASLLGSLENRGSCWRRRWDRRRRQQRSRI